MEGPGRYVLMSNISLLFSPICLYILQPRHFFQYLSSFTRQVLFSRNISHGLLFPSVSSMLKIINAVSVSIFPTERTMKCFTGDNPLHIPCFTTIPTEEHEHEEFEEHECQGKTKTTKTKCSTVCARCTFCATMCMYTSEFVEFPNKQLSVFTM